MKRKYNSGDVIGNIRIIEKDPTSKSGKYICMCGRCGRTFSVLPAHLKGTEKRKCYTKSCGCLKKDLKRNEALEKNHFKFYNGTSISVIEKIFNGDGKTKRNCSTGYTGVYEYKRKNGSVYYKAKIVVQKKQISLGRFDHIEDAIFARKTAEYKYFGTLIESYQNDSRSEQLA